MRIVANNEVGVGTATLTDDQTEVRDGGLVGDINFQAAYVAGTPNEVQVQFTNTFTDNATMRIVVRRWASF